MSQQLICESAALAEGGAGVRFDVVHGGSAQQAFVVRFDGVPRAFLNRCAHVSVELDWMPGQFFDDAGLYLMCATHGAVYEPDTGRCAGGPCRGGGLEPVAVVERDGAVYWIDQRGADVDE